MLLSFSIVKQMKQQEFISYHSFESLNSNCNVKDLENRKSSLKLKPTEHKKSTKYSNSSSNNEVPVEYILFEKSKLRIKDDFSERKLN